MSDEEILAQMDRRNRIAFIMTVAFFALLLASLLFSLSTF